MNKKYVLIIAFVFLYLTPIIGYYKYEYMWLPFILTLVSIIVYWFKNKRKPLMLGIYTITVLILYIFFFTCYLLNKS